MEQRKILGTFSPGLLKNDLIRTLFKANDILLKPSRQHAADIDLIIGWGRKPNTLSPIKYAKEHNIPYLTLEDGFIHSMSQGRLGAPSWSLVTDELGIFYDAKTRSSLEQLINDIILTPVEISQTSGNINLITHYGITKYNNAQQVIPDYIKHLKQAVLVVDQVQGDMSIPYALASQESFNNMLEAAISENPSSDIIIKIHPDVINGKRKGCITLPKRLPPNIYLIGDNLNPIRLMAYVTKVYVVSSQLGFEALLLKKAVTCFGVPFYAGWGLTDDRSDHTADAFKRRKKGADLETIFYAAYCQYSHYCHPDTQKPCQLEDILEYVKHQHIIQSKLHSKLFCLGFTPWKRQFITHYLKTSDNQVAFVKTPEQAVQSGFDINSTICLWSSRYESEAQALTKRFGNPIWRIEDGFIRSVSLGSNYAPPASLVIDKSGLYFDPTQPSDLELILSGASFDAALIQRAQKLRQQLITQAISKYNGGDRGVENLFSHSHGRIIILVPGQVADDASILKGCTDVNDNLSLLRLVRKKNPEAYIVYKPHPDVISGNRNGNIEDIEVVKYCDQVVLCVSITDCLSQCDEVHTMTSLVGFEALIRGLKVHCYGIPFYSNWGLTKDRHLCDRRKRTLSVDELIAGVLIKYPLYMNWETRHFTTPEFVTNAIHDRLQQPAKYSNILTSAVLRKIKKKINLVKTVLNPQLK